MPGLYENVSLTENLHRSLRLLLRAHATAGVQLTEAFYQSDECLIASVGLGCLEGTRCQPGRVAGSCSILMPDIEIYNSFELSKEYSSQEDNKRCAQLTMCLGNGPDFVSDFEEEFNIVIYEVESRKLVFLVGHIVSNPFFYRETSKVSPAPGSKKQELLAVARERVEIDPVDFHLCQCLHFLTVQYLSDQRTLYV